MREKKKAAVKKRIFHVPGQTVYDTGRVCTHLEVGIATEEKSVPVPDRTGNTCMVL